MSWVDVISKILLEIGIKILSSLIPSLSGLLGGPIGWIVSWLVGKLTGILYNLVERYMRFAEIDAKVKKDLADAIHVTEVYRSLQNNPAATEQEKNDAKEKFRDAVRALGHLGLQQN